MKGGFEFVEDKKWVASHCGRENASQAYDCEVSDAEHYFSVAIDQIADAFDEGQYIEYEHIRYIPKLFGVDMSNLEDFVVYMAVHEAAHMIEYEYGFPTPSEHDTQYEVILIDLMAKYWSVL